MTNNTISLSCTCGANVATQSWKMLDGLQCMVCDRKNYLAYCNIHNQPYQGRCYVCHWDKLKPFDYSLYPEDFLWEN